MGSGQPHRQRWHAGRASSLGEAEHLDHAWAVPERTDRAGWRSSFTRSSPLGSSWWSGAGLSVSLCQR
eukprot:6014036-Pyramimonas_sp.AAC.1